MYEEEMYWVKVQHVRITQDSKTEKSIMRFQLFAQTEIPLTNLRAIWANEWNIIQARFRKSRINVPYVPTPKTLKILVRSSVQIQRLTIARYIWNELAGRRREE
jgi:hypothetical protein